MSAAAQSNAWLEVTAAKGIQDYILRTDRLKEMIGASELVDQLPAQLPAGMLSQTLRELCLAEGEGYELLSATAGGARLVFFSEEKAREFLRLWPLIASQFAPGVEISQGLALVNGNLADAPRRAEGAVATNRNRLFPRLPVAGPLAGRNPDTGLATTGRFNGERFGGVAAT